MVMCRQNGCAREAPEDVFHQEDICVGPPHGVVQCSVAGGHVPLQTQGGTQCRVTPGTGHLHSTPDM